MSVTASFVGNIGNDAETRSAGDSKVTNFSVAVSQGFGEQRTTAWYRVDLWGARGEKLQQYLTKGTKVFVSGELTQDEYQGKPQLRVRADRVDPFLGKKEDRGSAPSGGGGGSFTPPDDDLSDDVPFASCNPALERRVR